MNSKKIKGLAFWVALLIATAILYVVLESRRPALPFQAFSVFNSDINSDRVRSVRVDENQIDVTLRSQARYRTMGVIDDDLLDLLSRHGIPVQRGEEERSLGMSLVLTWVPILVLLLVFLLFMRRASSGGSNILQLRKSRARLVTEQQITKFANVGGCKEAKAELRDAVDFLKDPKPWVQAGARLPRAILLVGPPGCGKTLLARAVAGETSAKFYSVAASEFVEMFIGVGAARVRDMFETAVKNAPALIFIDELDAVGRRRGSGVGWANDEREQTLNQILVGLDGFEKNDRVVVLAATNRPDILDKALLRPGRFDRIVRIPALSRQERLDTLAIHCVEKKVNPEVDLAELADQTPGYTGAQLESLANEAALLAVRRSREGTSPAEIQMADFSEALSKAEATRTHLFDKLDSILIESASQVAEPTGKARVRVTLPDGSFVEGEVVWADSAFIKLRRLQDQTETLIAKRQIQRIEALHGTGHELREEIVVDQWASSSVTLD